MLIQRNVLCTRCISKLDRNPDVNSHEVQYRIYWIASVQ